MSAMGLVGGQGYLVDDFGKHIGIHLIVTVSGILN